MRKLLLQMQMTIDGFVAGPNGENDWVFLPGAQDPAALQATIDLAGSCDTILAGRKMIQGFIGHWENVLDNQPDNPWHPFAKHMVSHRKIIFSRAETGGITGRNLEMENGDLATVVTDLKKQPGKNIIAYGGVAFASALIELNLVDEYFLVINPVVIGKGLSVFKERKVMTLESSVVYTNGKMLNKYVPVQAGV